MELTAKEAKRIERLRKQLRLWPKTRWLVVLISVMFACLSVLMGSFSVKQLIDEQRQMRFLFSESERKSSDAPQAAVQRLAGDMTFLVDEQASMTVMVLGGVVLSILYVFGSATFFAILIRDWHGNTEKTLLLKLYDEAVGRQNEAAKSIAVGAPSEGQNETKRGS